jgi:alkanesulfonate monooxygenase SsuD/methylene tetrahydromethanopterin reductase-like flavin-dependent oxidoreductase (luciferase family)
MGLSVSRDPARLIRRRTMGHRGEVHVVSGDPDEVTAQLAGFAAAGVQHMQLNFLDFPRTEGLDLFLAEVLPRFERAGT